MTLTPRNPLSSGFFFRLHIPQALLSR
jgi:hypothetical protein